MAVHTTVTYIVYQADSTNVLVESSMTFPDTTNCNACEQAVHAMYKGLNVIIRNSTPFYS
jgi:hypothetical protein